MIGSNVEKTDFETTLNTAIGTTEDPYLEMIQDLDFEPTQDTDSDDNSIEYKTVMVDTDDMNLADNIRPFDKEFIKTLADSIATNGQLQSCLGYEKTLEDGSKRIILIAGQHRFMAIKLLNYSRIKEGKKKIPVMVRIANRELTPEEIVELQITENLQNKMTPAQEAAVISNLWHGMKKVKENEGKKMSVTKFARRIGRSRKTVSDAIKYVDGVSPLIQELVDNKLLPYTQAILLTNIDDLIKRGNVCDITEEDRVWKQCELAQYFITKKFNLRQASAYLKKLREENSFVGPLFGDEWYYESGKKGNLLAIRDTANKEGRKAAAWLVNMIHTARIIKEKTGSVKTSHAIHSAVDSLDEAFDDFKRDIKPSLTEKEYKKLFGEDE